MTTEETEFAQLVRDYELVKNRVLDAARASSIEPRYEMPEGRNTPMAMVAYKHALASYEKSQAELNKVKAEEQVAFDALDNWIPKPAKETKQWITAPYFDGQAVALLKNGRSFYFVKARNMSEIEGTVQNFMSENNMLK